MYDKRHHERLNEAAKAWCERFANDIAQREGGEEASEVEEDQEGGFDRADDTPFEPPEPEPSRKGSEGPVASPLHEEASPETAAMQEEARSEPASPIASILVKVLVQTPPRPKKAASQSPEARAAVLKKPRARAPTPKFLHFSSLLSKRGITS